MDWIDDLKPVFSEVSHETGLRLGHDTHYDARNFVFSLRRGREIHRIDFQPMDDGTIQITKLIDTFPVLPGLFTFLHNTIPLFPYLGEVSCSEQGTLKPPFLQPVIGKRILEIVQNAI